MDVQIDSAHSMNYIERMLLFMIKLINEKNDRSLKFYDLKNADALRDEFVDMLMNFDKKANPYNTDVYLYVNEDTNTGELYEFVNVGGNSWLDDDHYTIYTDKQHYEDVFEFFEDESQIADALNMTLDDLKEEALVALDMQDDYWIDEIGYSEIRQYVKENEEYMDILSDAYDDAIDDMYSEYAEKADDIIDYFNEKQRETY